MRRWIYFAGVLIAAFTVQAHAFDHGYTEYSALLTRHTQWLPGNYASVVNYTGLMHERASLQPILSRFSEVQQTEFNGWSEVQQKAFLINAYNAFTLELVLTRYPDIASIKDIGGLLRSPWKIEFFRLLGKKRNLDWIEHEQLRPHYQDPRAHFAINCASIGCPALRPEAYVADRLDAQLDEAFLTFMSDRTRNHFDPGSNTISMSSIFKWFRKDFEGGFDGRRSLQDWVTAAADELADRPIDHQKILEGGYELNFLEYDWSLNDIKSQS